MLIELKPELFKSFDDYKSLNKLLQDLTYKRRYDIFIDIDEVKDCALYNRIDKEDQMLIEEYFEKQVTEDNEVNHIVSLEMDSTNFTVHEAIRFFNQPVEIILENSLNDSYFIDALILNFKKASKKIKKYKEEGWLVLGNAGGANNISNYIQSISANFGNLPKENHKYLRCFVILDSDKKYPNMPYEQGLQNTIDYLKKNEVVFHILEKREMENYIPDEVIDDIAFNYKDEYLKAYLKLNPNQKDYFDIEKGYENKNYNSLISEIQLLYNDNDDYKLLRKGINGTKYNKENFKAEFPKLFCHPKINQENLLKRTQHQINKNELKEILSKINELL